MACAGPSAPRPRDPRIPASPPKGPSIDPRHPAPALPLRPAQPTASAAHVLGQPILLAGVVLAIAWSLHREVPLGPGSVAILLGSMAYLVAMERWIPFRRSWQPTGREWRRDWIYLVINGLASAAMAAGIGVLAIHVAGGALGLPLAVEIPVGLALYALAGYWTHRLSHEVDFLWQLHGVHHTPNKINAWNNNVFHVLDLLFQNGIALATLVLVGFSSEAVFAITSFGQVVGYLGHANADFRGGWLNYLVLGPEQHRLHHSTDLEEAGHYTLLPVWDLVFGTFAWRPRREPRGIGVQRPEAFPSPDSIVRNAVHPVRAWFGRRS